MTETVRVPDNVYKIIQQIAEERDMPYSEATRHVFQEAGYDV